MKLRSEGPHPVAAFRRRVTTTLAIGITCLIGVAYVSSASASSTHSSSRSKAPAATVVAPGVPTLAELYAGNQSAPPSTSPPAAKHANIWWVTCGLAIAECAKTADAAKQAAAALGIPFHIANGNEDISNGYATAVDQAIAGGATAIISQVPCITALQAFRTAKAKGIVTLGVEQPDCADSPKTGDPNLFTGDLEYTKAISTGSLWFSTDAKMAAAYLIDETHGKVHAIAVSGSGDQATDNLTSGFARMMAKCKTCSITEKVPYVDTEISADSPITARVNTALLDAASGTNSIFAPYDALVGAPVSVATSVQTSGRKLLSVGGQGQPTTTALIQEGQWDASIAFDPTWMGWAAIDEINRLMNHKPRVPEGVGFKLITSGHGLPAAGQWYKSSIPYKSDYKKAWAAAKKSSH